MDPIEKFESDKRGHIAAMGRDPKLRALGQAFVRDTAPHQYSYNFKWLGRPMIQLPQDIVAMQEIIWDVRPDLIIETGIAHGGGLVFYASMLELIGRGHVLGIDIDIRPHNRKAIESHPLAKRISMIQGSSIDPGVLAQVESVARASDRVLVCLDSNHTHDHVLRELEIYSPFVKKGSYIAVFDTVVEDMPELIPPGRAWAKGNNPMTAVHAFLKKSDRFEIDRELSDKLLISVAPNGYLRCIR